MARHHFLRPDGRVISSVEDPSDYALMQFGGYTEVQVVPIDAVVIDGPLPEVTPDSKPGYFDIDGRTFYFSESDTVAEIEFSGRAILAIAAYLRQHPTVDEAQVKALWEDLDTTPMPELGAENIYRFPSESVARHLVAQGWTKDGAR